MANILPPDNPCFLSKFLRCLGHALVSAHFCKGYLHRQLTKSRAVNSELQQNTFDTRAKQADQVMLAR